MDIGEIYFEELSEPDQEPYAVKQDGDTWSQEKTEEKSCLETEAETAESTGTDAGAEAEKEAPIGRFQTEDRRRKKSPLITYQVFFLFCTFIVALISQLYHQRAEPLLWLSLFQFYFNICPGRVQAVSDILN